jgi:hypothetical protein
MELELRNCDFSSLMEMEDDLGRAGVDLDIMGTLARCCGAAV